MRRRLMTAVGAAAVSLLLPALPAVGASQQPSSPNTATAPRGADSGRAAATIPPGAVISNGTVTLGVNNKGDLNFDCAGRPECPSPSVQGVSIVGLRFTPLNTEGTADGCACEGWGAADAKSGLSGYANESSGTSSTLTVKSFTANATSATSTVVIQNADLPGYRMQVAQRYAPSLATPNLYDAAVTITNTGTKTLGDVRYRRVMDWDVEPSAFNEWVTIQGATSSNALLFDSDNGFAGSDPLVGGRAAYDTGSIDALESDAVCDYGSSPVCDFTDLGSGGTYPSVTSPSDHGALFDFGFGSFAPGESITFHILYGAAGSEAAALSAVGRAGAEAYSFGESNCPESGSDAAGCFGLPANAGVEQGRPTTFIFGFSGVGGTGVQTCEPPTKSGTGGNDKLSGTDGNDKIHGNGGRDAIDGHAGTDEVCGDSGSDVVYGRADNDNVQGGSGNDRLYGGGGSDIVNGGPGHDAIFAGSGTNTVVANDGEIDCIVVASSTDALSVDTVDIVRTPGSPGSCSPGFWLSPHGA